MISERPVAVVTDSGSSIRPEDKIARELGVVILPLDVTFYEKGQPIPYADLDLQPQEFYEKMATSEKLPTTSGAVTGRALETYKLLAQKTNSVVSVHLTAKHSAVYSSAVTAAHLVQEENPELLIEVIDSKNISLGTWFAAEVAARLAQEGAPLEEIKQATLAVIPKIETYTALATLDNVRAGGRVSTLEGFLGSMLHINPVLKVEDGKLVGVVKVRTFGKAKDAMLERVRLTDAEIVKMAVMHANAPQTAEEVKQALQEFYSGEIGVFEAGPVLGVHAGVGTVGISFQKA